MFKWHRKLVHTVLVTKNFINIQNAAQDFQKTQLLELKAIVYKQHKVVCRSMRRVNVK